MNYPPHYALVTKRGIMSEQKLNARVIITYSRSLVALRLAQSLGQRGAEIIGCDDVSMTVLSFSKYVTTHAIYASPHDKPDQFIRDLVQIVKDNKPHDGRPYVLMPAFYEARLIAEHRDKFGDDIIVTVPPFEAINAVDPKDHFAKTLQNFDIASPKVWFPQSESDMEDIAEETDYPVFIKPPDEVGGRGIMKAKNPSELKQLYRELTAEYPGKQILVQAIAEGRDYCFCGLFDNGQLVSSMVYRNTQKFPIETGAGSVRETVPAHMFNPIASELMHKVKWHGVCEIDFMWNGDENSTPMMIEVNPRFWSGLDHSVKSNVDFPYQLYQLFVEGRVSDCSEAIIGHKTQLPGMSTLGAIETFMNEAVNFEKLEAEWPTIKQTVKNGEWSKGLGQFMDKFGESFSIDHAYQMFKNMRDEIKKAESISVPDDDPFVGLGVLFILGSLLRYGKLPPEVKR